MGGPLRAGAAGPVHIPLALLASGIAGGLWALLPAYLRVVRGVNEVITTLLMNYIAIYAVGYVVNGPMMEPGAPYPFSPVLRESAHLPLILPEADAHAGILVGLAAAVVLHLLLHRGAIGYRIRAVGLNAQAAAYGGISVRRTMLGVMFVSGALAGLAGAGEVMGLKYRLFDRFSPGWRESLEARDTQSLDGMLAMALAGESGNCAIPEREAAAIRRALPQYSVADFLRAMHFDAHGTALFREGAKRIGMA